MPWRISQMDGRWCVVKEGESKPVPGGCHDNRVDAVKHQRALYANEDSMSASSGWTEEDLEKIKYIPAAEPPCDCEESVKITVADVVGGVEGLIDSGALVAAAAPIAPPKDWFDAPEPDHAEPLTVEADGRVHGHLALWDACHTGFMNGPLAKCVMAPKSASGYAGFHLGQLETADGDTISVGKIVYGGPHASLTAGLEQARIHYDRTSSVGAFVRARDGKHGIYLTGAVKSDLSPEGLRDIRANPPSGDWRGMGNGLELIGALSVGVPGFQTPVLTASAEGDVEALILPGFVPPVDTSRSKAYIRQRDVIAASIQEGT